jgi:hypothetical protein
MARDTEMKDFSLSRRHNIAIAAGVRTALSSSASFECRTPNNFNTSRVRSAPSRSASCGRPVAASDKDGDVVEVVLPDRQYPTRPTKATTRTMVMQ